MRHGKFGHKLGVTTSHRKALLLNLTKSLIEHGQLKTTHARCKALKIYCERLVTKAKEDNLHHRRLVFKKVNDHGLVKKLFTEIAPKFKERNGGYTRILKLPDGRVGDNAKMSQISFVE